MSPRIDVAVDCIARKAPDKPEEVEIGFEAGTPISVNGKKLGPVALLNALNDIAATHGVGRTDLVENRLVGMKSRGAYETRANPARHRTPRTGAAYSRRKLHFQQALSGGTPTRLLRLVVFAAARISRWLLQCCAAARHRLCRLRLWKGTLNVTKRLSLSLCTAPTSPVFPWPLQSKDAEVLSIFSLCRSQCVPWLSRKSAFLRIFAGGGSVSGEFWRPRPFIADLL